jgi:DNA-binding MarR family transcriptional regulator
MSNIYTTQAVRDKHGLSWSEEYILGMIAKQISPTTMSVLSDAKKRKVMSHATTHKYLTSLSKKKYVAKPNHVFVLTNKAVNFFKDLHNVNQ